MFDENFCFAPVRSGSLGSTTSSSTEQTSREVSPCSPINALPPPAYTMTDLAACLGRSRLRQDAQICYDSPEAYANMDDDAGWTLDPVPSTESESSDRPRSRMVTSSQPQSRRAQRHSNTRLLFSAAHRKDIAALVARMVESEEQCSVAPAEILSSTPSTTTISVDDDEGYDSSSELWDPSTESRQASTSAPRMRIRYRRSMELKNNSACVRKPVRLRKDKKWRSES